MERIRSRKRNERYKINKVKRKKNDEHELKRIRAKWDEVQVNVHVDLKLHQIWMMFHKNLIWKLCIQLCMQSIGSSVPYQRQHTRSRTLLQKKCVHLTKTSDFHSWLIFSNGIWQRWCHFAFFQICNLNASRMNNDIMYIITSTYWMYSVATRYQG